MGFQIDKILTLFEPDVEAIKKGKQRQEAIWRGDEPDYLPILIGGIKNPYTESGRCKVEYDWKLKREEWKSLNLTYFLIMI